MGHLDPGHCSFVVRQAATRPVSPNHFSCVPSDLETKHRLCNLFYWASVQAKSFQLCPVFVTLLYPWHFLSKNSAVGCHALLQGIFPTR